MKILKSNNNIFFNLAILLAVFSSIFFFGPSKIANAQYYQGGSYEGQSSPGGSYGGSYYAGNSAGTGTYSGDSSTGNYYGGNSYSGNSYGGSSQTASVGSITPSAAPTFSKCEPYLKSYLGYGKNNDSGEVKKLQTFLNKYSGEKLAVSGVFDLPTFEAVKRFQDKYANDILEDSWGLSCNTGYVYITTLAKINDIVCNTSTDFKNIPLPDPRPVYYCDGHIDPVTKTPLPCTPVTTSVSSFSASTNSTTPPVSSSTVIANSAPSVTSNQTASVGSPPASILSVAKNSWRKLLGQ